MNPSMDAKVPIANEIAYFWLFCLFVTGQVRLKA